jgi:hypothetical protein
MNLIIVYELAVSGTGRYTHGTVSRREDRVRYGARRVLQPAVDAQEGADAPPDVEA